MLLQSPIAILVLLFCVNKSWEFPEKKATPPQNSIGTICKTNSKNIDFSIEKCNVTNKKVLKVTIRESEKPTEETTTESSTHESNGQSDNYPGGDYDYDYSEQFDYTDLLESASERRILDELIHRHLSSEFHNLRNRHGHFPPRNQDPSWTHFQHPQLSLPETTTEENSLSSRELYNVNKRFCEEAIEDEDDVRIPNGDFHPKFEMVTGLGFYRFHATPRSWEAARRICEAEDAHLAVPNSHEEALALQEIHKRCPFILSSHFNAYQYVGIHDRFSEGHWETVVDEPLNETGYVNWAFGQPDNAHHIGENCLCMNRQGYYNDVPCWTELPFTCEHN